MSNRNTREPVTAVRCDRGTVVVIEPETGELLQYKVRGMERFQKERPEEFNGLVRMGVVHEAVAILPELPKEWDVEYERTDILGHAITEVKQVLDEISKVTGRPNTWE